MHWVSYIVIVMRKSDMTHALRWETGIAYSQQKKKKKERETGIAYLTLTTVINVW